MKVAMRRALPPDIDERIFDQVMLSATKHGLGSVSTKEIAASLGISEPVIFAHFKSKHGLIEATFKAAAERLWPALEFGEEDLFLSRSDN